MTEQLMCCGGTCVRAVCEYHKDVPPEPEPAPETPRVTAEFPLQTGFVWYSYDPFKGWVVRP